MTKMNEVELVVWAAVFAAEVVCDAEASPLGAARTATKAVWDLRELSKEPSLDEHTRAALEQICPKMLPPGEY